MFPEDEALRRQEIEELLELTDRKSVREHYIIPAMEIGAIKYTIPDKPNSRLQKYRLTALGREMLKQINGKS